MHQYKLLVFSSAYNIHTHIPTLMVGQHLHIITVKVLYNDLNCHFLTLWHWLQGVSMMTTLTTDWFSVHYSERLQYNLVDSLQLWTCAVYKLCIKCAMIYKLRGCLGRRHADLARESCNTYSIAIGWWPTVVWIMRFPRGSVSYN